MGVLGEARRRHFALRCALASRQILSLGQAFYYMKQHGVARETCSPYRMRCFHDQSTISMEAADFKSAVAHAKTSEAATMCHTNVDALLGCTS